jgi:hypothetical protein
MTDFLDRMKTFMATTAQSASDTVGRMTGVQPKTDLTPQGAPPEEAGKTITGGKRLRHQKRTHKRMRQHKKLKKTHRRR